MTQSLFNFAGISPALRGRIDAALAKLARYNGVVRSLGEELEAAFARGELVTRNESDGMIDYNRRRFNGMNHHEQAAYIKRLEAKRYYWANYSDNTGTMIPKIVYEAMTIPIKTG